MICAKDPHIGVYITRVKVEGIEEKGKGDYKKGKGEGMAWGRYISPKVISPLEGKRRLLRN